MTSPLNMWTARTDVLETTYGQARPENGWPIILLHGFPYDIHAYTEVVPILADAGARVVVPYLRGFGPTRFRFPDTPRSGQQAALGSDVIGLLDALQLDSAVLAGFDWAGCPPAWPLPCGPTGSRDWSP